MPSGLKRFQQSGQLHFITFSCYGRAPLLQNAEAAVAFENTLERVRRWYGLCISGYVVMPEHVHLLVSEPERGSLGIAIQMLKQVVARRLRAGGVADRIWQPRYYDFNGWSEPKRIEKLRYTHRNPVRRGLVALPQDWPWSSFRHYATGLEGVVEIEPAANRESGGDCRLDLRGVEKAMSTIKRRHTRWLKLAVALVIIFGGGVLYLRLFAGSVQQRLLSPDGQTIAECRILDFAAATDSAATTVQLRTRFNPFRHTVFSGLLYGGKISMSWTDSNTLVVKCLRCSTADLRGMEQRWNAVSIRYIMADSSQP